MNAVEINNANCEGSNGSTNSTIYCMICLLEMECEFSEDKERLGAEDKNEKEKVISAF